MEGQKKAVNEKIDGFSYKNSFNFLIFWDFFNRYTIILDWIFTDRKLYIFQLFMIEKNNFKRQKILLKSYYKMN